MEIWDLKVRENLYGSAYLKVWDDMPYELKTIIAESISEALISANKSVTNQDLD